MKQTFILSNNQLLSIANQMKEKIEEGLKADKQELRCLVSYLSNQKIVDDYRALALDFGGTNLRGGIVSMAQGKFKIENKILETKLPIIRGEALSKDRYFAVQSDLINALQPPPGLPLGYCFSYPTLPMADGDATLIKWTKEVNVPEVLNKPVGALLKEHLIQSGSYICSEYVVINDTIAGLFAGWAMTKADAHIGLIVGTGTNIATFIDEKNIPKLGLAYSGNRQLPVNLESGNFTPPFLSEWDDVVDRESTNPGEQRFEKAVSGVYLSQIFKARYPNAQLDANEGVPGLLKIIEGQYGFTIDQIGFAKTIIERSAKLVASALAGTILFLSKNKSLQEVSITGEGSLLNLTIGYKSTVQKTLKNLLHQSDLSETSFTIHNIENANLIGSAVAVLANRHT